MPRAFQGKKSIVTRISQSGSVRHTAEYARRRGTVWPHLVIGLTIILSKVSSGSCFVRLLKFIQANSGLIEHGIFKPLLDIKFLKAIWALLGNGQFGLNTVRSQTIIP